MADSSELIEVEIIGRVDEADDIISLELARVDGAPLPGFTAGAHVDVHVGPGLVRQYSLCNSPAENHRYRLGVLREANSRGGSAEIHRTFRIGRRIQISAPRNNFCLVETARHSVLIAGGIGVTPLLAMSYRLQSVGAKFELHYCTRTRARTAFLNELASIFNSHLAMHYDDGPEDQRFSIGRFLPSSSEDVRLYVCGPIGFMDYVIADATRLGWCASNICLEYFTTNMDFGGDSFTVTAARSGLTVDIPADRTIAEVLCEHGVDVPLSCEQGVCGTCLTPVLEGVPEHRDLYQSEEEKACNTHMTLCCSRAKTRCLVLDI